MKSQAGLAASSLLVVSLLSFAGAGLRAEDGATCKEQDHDGDGYRADFPFLAENDCDDEDPDVSEAGVEMCHSYDEFNRLCGRAGR